MLHLYSNTAHVETNPNYHMYVVEQLVADLNESKAECIRKSSELSQLKTGNSRLLTEIDLLTKKNADDKQKLLEQHADSLRRALEEAKRRWSEVRVE